jgi:alkylmercury lyase
MKIMTVDEAVVLLKGRWGRQTSASVAFDRAFLPVLCQGHPVAAQAIAEKLGQPVAVVEDVFRQLKASACEFNEKGELVGAALTLTPTPHHFYVNGQHLYTWCAIDTLFLPAHIGQTAAVVSTCPVTGQVIQLTVSPQRIETAAPASTVLSVVLNTTCSSGLGSSFCGRIHFFATREAAKEWVSDTEDIGIFTLDEAYQIARQVYIEPFLQHIP